MGIEQLVILVLIGLISLINWIVQKSAEVRARRKAELESSPNESFHSREEPSPFTAQKAPERESRPTQGDESMRQLMEALGVELPEAEAPRVSQPPPPLPEMEKQSAPLAPPRLPSLVEMANQFENRSMRAAEGRELSWAERESLARAVPKSSSKSPVRNPGARPKRVGQLLSSPGGLRNGILLSEILGPPKALRRNEN